jgi:hypothetical protein
VTGGPLGAGAGADVAGAGADWFEPEEEPAEEPDEPPMPSAAGPAGAGMAGWSECTLLVVPVCSGVAARALDSE